MVGKKTSIAAIILPLCFPGLPLRLKQGGLLRSLYVPVERVSCASVEVAAGACDVRISHIHGSLSG